MSLSRAHVGEQTLRSFHLGAGGYPGPVVGGGTHPTGPLLSGGTPEHRGAHGAPPPSLAAFDAGVTARGQWAPTAVANRPVCIGHQAGDWADDEAPLAVVAEQGVNLVDNREFAALGHGSLWASRLAGPAAEALFDVDLERHVSVCYLARGHRQPRRTRTARYPCSDRTCRFPWHRTTECQKGRPRSTGHSVSGRCRRVR